MPGHALIDLGISLEDYAAAKQVELHKAPLKMGGKILFAAMLAVTLAGCGAGIANSPDQGQGFDDGNDGDALEGGNAPVDNPVPLPTNTVESFSTNSGEELVAQTFISNELGFASTHIFTVDAKGDISGLYGIIGTNDAELEIIEDGAGSATVSLTGNSLSESDDYSLGNSGYRAEEALSQSEMTEWLGNMNPTGTNIDGVEQIKTLMAASPDVEPVVTIATTYNLDPSGKQLLDMGLSIKVTVGDQEVILTTLLDPVTNSDVFANFKLAAVVPNLDGVVGNTDVKFELVPDTWTEIEDGQFVSPEFVQEQIEVRAEGYELTNDGIIMQDGDVVPGIQVTVDGRYVVVVGDNIVVIDQDSVSFGEDGIEVEGYELDGNGDWIEAAPKTETITIDGVSMTLGEPDANGWSEVTDKAIIGEMNAEDAASKLDEFNPGSVGFAPEEAKLVYNEDSQKLQIVNPNGEAIAVWNHGAKEMVWDYDMMFVNGENVLFRIAKTWGMNGINPLDLDAAKEDSVKLDAQFEQFMGVQYKGMWGSKGYIINSDGKLAIGVQWVTKEQLPPMEMERVDVDGDVFFLDADGEIVKLKMKNMDGMTRFWN